MTWVWSTMLTVMTTEHRRRWRGGADYVAPTDSALVASFQALLRNAAAAEWAAVDSWQPPESDGVARWGKRQARTAHAWEVRWRGLAQAPSSAMIRMNYAKEFDDTAAAWAVGQRRRDWRARGRSEQHRQHAGR